MEFRPRNNNLALPPAPCLPSLFTARTPVTPLRNTAVHPPHRLNRTFDPAVDGSWFLGDLGIHAVPTAERRCYDGEASLLGGGRFLMRYTTRHAPLRVACVVPIIIG